MSNKPVKIMETVLRDGHQSLAATRMRTTDMIGMLEQLDDVGASFIKWIDKIESGFFQCTDIVSEKCKNQSLLWFQHFQSKEWNPSDA